MRRVESSLIGVSSALPDPRTGESRGESPGEKSRGTGSSAPSRDRRSFVGIRQRVAQNLDGKINA